ncbi:L,D-transpeptidase [Burkholderia metallica]|uniref:L,D-transpeptidase n=1 Tax=Burkholderia metallica TaxID=488729 RepID=UPI00097150EB|nr:L,D-transpeptidase [Burkholderia metallica]MCA8017863.1 L,D-transpeptidase [Burkholderia metallica]
MSSGSTRNQQVGGKKSSAAKSIVVDLSGQSVQAFDGAETVFRFDCVTGDSEHPTDRGAFRIMRKYPSYRSRACNVQMDCAMFFTGDGKAFHPYHGPMPLSLVFLAAADSDAVAVTVDSLSAGHGGYAALVRSPSRAALATLAGGCDTLARR